MTSEDFAIICGDGKLLKVKRETLAAASDYFRALFETNMMENRENLLDLRSCANAPLYLGTDVKKAFDRETLRQILPTKEHLHPKKRIGRGSGWLEKSTRRFFSSSVDAETSPLARCSDRETFRLLLAASYFQAHWWTDRLQLVEKRHAAGRGPIGVSDLVTAIKVLPHAECCGLTDVYQAAMNLATTHFIEFTRLSNTGSSERDRALHRSVRAIRMGATCGRESVSAILRVDCFKDCSGALRCSYAMVDFAAFAGNCDEKQWKPRLLDLFTLGPNENLIDSVVLDNYVHIVTRQYCPTSEKTKFRVHTWNPFIVTEEEIADANKKITQWQCNTKNRRRSLKNSSSQRRKHKESYYGPEEACHDTVKDSCLSRAWTRGSQALVKSGYLDKITVTSTKMTKSGMLESFAIHVKSSVRIIKDKRTRITRKKSICDEVTYDPVTEKWKHITRNFSETPDGSDSDLKASRVSTCYADRTATRKATTYLNQQRDEHLQVSVGNDGEIRLAIDKTLQSGGDIFLLQHHQLTCNTEITTALYSISSRLIDDCNSSKLTGIENLLINSSPQRLFQLYYPNLRS